MHPRYVHTDTALLEKTAHTAAAAGRGFRYKYQGQ